jgi:hypothetical protein
MNMKIELHEIPVRDLVEGFRDEAENGVTAYGGRLDIRPKYQREFIYSPEQQRAVMQTVLKGFPLNTMYWAVRDDGRYEVIDGQQRTLSVCKFAAGDFSVPWGGSPLYFHNLKDDERERVLNYRLMVYFCEGSDTEKLEWFKTINIAGEELTAQELRNAVYAGPWTADAKRYFSRTECPAFQVGGKYLAGSAIRQDYLETAIRWLCGGEPEAYMASHQHDASASPLWLHFQNVISWVRTVFPHYRAKMKGLDWGRLYREYAGREYDPAALEARVAALLKDDEVQKDAGIWEFVLSGEAPHKRKLLNLRAFSESQKEAAYERQGGNCAICGKHFELAEMQGDHIVPWSKGGKTLPDNLQMLCALCNQQKGGALA